MSTTRETQSSPTLPTSETAYDLFIASVAKFGGFAPAQAARLTLLCREHAIVNPAELGDMLLADNEKLRQLTEYTNDTHRNHAFPGSVRSHLSEADVAETVTSVFTLAQDMNALSLLELSSITNDRFPRYKGIAKTNEQKLSAHLKPDEAHRQAFRRAEDDFLEEVQAMIDAKTGRSRRSNPDEYV